MTARPLQSSPLPALHHAEEEAEVPFAEEAGMPPFWPAGALLTPAERAPELVALVALRHLAAQSPQCHHAHLLPAEMDGQGVHARIPWRAATGEEVEAPVQQEPARRRWHGPQVSGQT